MNFNSLFNTMQQILILRGGPTSGNWGHVGIPGKRGGSGRGGGFKRIGVKHRTSKRLSRNDVKSASRKKKSNSTSNLSVAKTKSDAHKQNISQADVLDSIMKTNPPEQVKDGRMTPDQWKSKFMSDEPQGYAMINSHPDVMNLPVAAGSPEKAKRFAKSSKSDQPPIVVDSNDKIEARHGGTKLDRAFGKQPHTIIDGKHRLTASLSRGDKDIKTLVPKRKLDEIWEQSHTAEVRDFAESYFKRKGFPVLEDKGDEWVVERKGVRKIFNKAAMERIGSKLNHKWNWN